MRSFESKFFLNANNNFRNETIFIIKQSFKESIYYFIARTENVLYVKIQSPKLICLVIVNFFIKIRAQKMS